MGLFPLKTLSQLNDPPYPKPSKKKITSRKTKKSKKRGLRVSCLDKKIIEKKATDTYKSRKSRPPPPPTVYLQNLDFFFFFAPVTALKIDDLVFNFQSSTPSVTLSKEARRISNGGGGGKAKQGGVR